MVEGLVVHVYVFTCEGLFICWCLCFMFAALATSVAHHLGPRRALSVNVPSGNVSWYPTPQNTHVSDACASKTLAPKNYPLTSSNSVWQIFSSSFLGFCVLLLQTKKCLQQLASKLISTQQHLQRCQPSNNFKKVQQSRGAALNFILCVLPSLLRLPVMTSLQIPLSSPQLCHEISFTLLPHGHSYRYKNMKRDRGEPVNSVLE